MVETPRSILHPKMVSRCTISSLVVALIRDAAATAHPREACGLLLGKPGRIEAATVAANVAADPLGRFEIAPAALFAALRLERGGGPALLGYWHSHPSGDARPSRTDAAHAEPDGRLWLVLGHELRAWRAGPAGLHDRFEPVELIEIGGGTN